LVYPCGNNYKLLEKVRMVLKDPISVTRMEKEAYKTIIEEWNAENAASRVIKLAQYVSSGLTNDLLFETGPCSKEEK